MVRMFNPHQHQQQQQHQFHQHLRQLQQLFQQQTPPPPPPPPPPPQPPPAHHITHHHQAARPMAVPAPAPPPARMVNLCSATQTIIAPNPMLQGALLMQQMQGSMRGFAMGGQQFPPFFAAGSRASLLGPVPMGVAIKTPHMGFPRHFTPHARYFPNDYQTPQPDRKREIEQKSANISSGHSAASSSNGQPEAARSSNGQSAAKSSSSNDQSAANSSSNGQSVASSSNGQSEAKSSSSSSSSRADEAVAVADPGSQGSSEQPDEPAAKKHKTQESEEPLEKDSAENTECKSPADAGDSLPEESVVNEPPATEAEEQCQADKQTDAADVDQPISGAPADAGSSDSVSAVKQPEAAPVQHQLTDTAAAAESSSSFFCYICNITCHNQQNFQSHMNGLTHQQKMMEIQHMSNACLVTLLPRVQESLQGAARKDGEKRPGLQRWCSTCQTHFTSNVMEHRRTKEHKRFSRSSSSSCTVCKLNFRTAREFVEHMQSAEHKQRVQQLWKESGSGSVEELNTVMLLGEDDGEFCSDDEREDEENGKEGLSAQMEVTMEDLDEDEEFDSDTVYGSSFVVPVSGFLCRLCDQFYHYESSARHAHCKTLKHFQNLKRYKALKKHEDSGSTSAEAAEEVAVAAAEGLLIAEESSVDPSASPITNTSSTPPQQEEKLEPEETLKPEPEPESELEEKLEPEPELEERSSERGRGRTSAKRRGRGGRRR
ncbi:cdkn1a interacting zinc finger protein 1a isoform X9 [Danio rerio]|uniref:Cdkn1a-interacting zinc finger protein 1a n=2 Tax=Danio rerio TaxID=7955 RepID=A0A0R4ITY1_DANRE|nr:cdkn1a interacting zinc finger protein 1a [Danio rerio]|eukprot:NP_001311442.1 cip1-interacting zinc finger protein [Danio rerio]